MSLKCVTENHEVQINGFNDTAKTIVSQNAQLSPAIIGRASDSSNNLEAKQENRHGSNSKPDSSIGSTIIYSGINTRENKSRKQRNKNMVEQTDQESISVTNTFMENDQMFQSKLSWTGDILFGSLLAIFSKYLNWV